MSSEIIFLIILVFLGFGALVFFLNKKLGELSEKNKPNEELLEWLKATGQRLDDQNKHFNQSLQSSTKTLNERLDNAARVIGQVQKNIGEMSEIGRGMKDLQEFLRSPKLRGNIGEQVLKELLTQMLPKQTFSLQFTFKSGEKVDAVIKTSAGLIPIDSKFPLENFRKMNSATDDTEKKLFAKEFERDVKKHIEDIARKYILPAEGTLDYALMYVTSEAVYYEVVNNESLCEIAGNKRVLAVSPTTFYAFLRAILMSFEGQKIEVQAREILSLLRAIQKDYVKVEDNLSVLQKHLTNAFNMMSQVFSSFTQLGQKITSTQSLEGKSKQVTKELES